MSKANDGGQAFPICELVWDVHSGHTNGMSLRDYFAIHASDEDARSAALRYLSDHSGKELCSREMARYYYADLMIAEREKGK